LDQKRQKVRQPVRGLLALGCAALAVLPRIQAASDSAAGPSALSGVLSRYCVTCHNARLAESGVALDALEAERPWADADTWERVLRQLRARTMPPAGSSRPDPKIYDALVASLASALDRGDSGKTAAVPRRATDMQLAAGLARLLWNGSPDAALVEAARSGRLRDRAALEAQVRRMLDDDRVMGLVRGFFDEWLGLNALAAMPADAAAFPEFDAELRQALLRETELFVESQLRADRPAMEIWTANYTYLNERLARHYGIPNVVRPEFRRVALPGSERAGLLGQGGFLTVTSVLTRHPAVDAPSTSPAARARWIRLHFLGVIAPHPPGSIPPLEKGVLLSAQLRTLPDPSCNACHANFFPMGYALENFDPLGRWRAQAGGEPIEVSGVLPDATEFEGPSGLRRVLLERRDAFLHTIAERLLAYAVDGKPGISEPVSAERMPAVRAILRDAARSGDTWSSLMAGIVSRAEDPAQ